MPPKRSKAPPKSATVIEGWHDQDLSDLTEHQIAWLAANPEVDAASVVAKIRANRGPPPAIPSRPHDSDNDWGVEASQMATGPDFPSQTVDPVIESSILGKRPQPPSPAPSATLQTSSPMRIGGSKPRRAPWDPKDPPSPSPSQDVDWEAYF
jgi:hypothetical protein